MGLMTIIVQLGYFSQVYGVTLQITDMLWIALKYYLDEYIQINYLLYILYRVQS